MVESTRSKRIYHEIPKNQGINITPLIDIVFQLLIFFMVASSLVKPNQIELHLPTSTSGTKSQEQADALTVTYRLVEGEPRITLNDRSLESLEALHKAMPRLQGVNGDAAQPVDVLIDRTVPYEEVIALLDTVRDAGYPRFSLLTLAPGSGPPTPPTPPTP